MTHLEMFIDLLIKFGMKEVPASPRNKEEFQRIKIFDEKLQQNVTVIDFDEGLYNYSYTNFKHCFVFRDDGTFLGHGAYE